MSRLESMTGFGIASFEVRNREGSALRSFMFMNIHQWSSFIDAWSKFSVGLAAK